MPGLADLEQHELSKPTAHVAARTGKTPPINPGECARVPLPAIPLLRGWNSQLIELDVLQMHRTLLYILNRKRRLEERILQGLTTEYTVFGAIPGPLYNARARDFHLLWRGASRGDSFSDALLAPTASRALGHRSSASVSWTALFNWYMLASIS